MGEENGTSRQWEQGSAGAHNGRAHLITFLRFRLVIIVVVVEDEVWPLCSIRAQRFVYMYVCLCLSMYVYVCVCASERSFQSTQTHTHTHTLILFESNSKAEFWGDIPF